MDAVELAAAAFMMAGRESELWGERTIRNPGMGQG